MASPTQVSYSKVTSKSQTVIPRSVRERLGLKPGDRLRYRESAGKIVLEKAETESDDPFVTFNEWSSEADAGAYDSL